MGLGWLRPRPQSANSGGFCLVADHVLEGRLQVRRRVDSRPLGGQADDGAALVQRLRSGGGGARRRSGRGGGEKARRRGGGEGSEGCW